MEKWEQGTRNRSGNRVRTFTGSDRLYARLSCQKNLMQHIGNVSAALYPIDYDEDVEIECRHKIVMQNGRKAYRDARAFGIQPLILAEDEPRIVGEKRKTASMVLKSELCQEAIRRGYDGTLHNQSRRSRKLLAALQAAIEELRPRFNKKLWLRYAHGEIDEIALLLAAGMIARAPQPKQRQTRCMR